MRTGTLAFCAQLGEMRAFMPCEVSAGGWFAPFKETPKYVHLSRRNSRSDRAAPHAYHQ